MVNKVKISELPHHGLFCMLYGVAGVGKTWNCLKTLPKKICYMPSEPRGYRRTTDAIGLTDKDAELITWEGIEDLLEFLTVVENFDPYKSVFFDSLTYTANSLKPDVGTYGRSALFLLAVSSSATRSQQL